jgi:hypothetical protein
MSVTLSHFDNITNLTLSTTAIGSTSNLKITKTLHRVEGMDNAVIGGAVSSGVVGRHYAFSFESNDISGLMTLNALTTPGSLVCTWVPSTTQAGTPMASVTITLTQCVIDSNGISPETKALGKYVVTGHCLAAASDADQLTIA